MSRMEWLTEDRWLLSMVAVAAGILLAVAGLLVAELLT